MIRKLLRAKIHRATVTHADVEYEGSITLPPELMAATDMYQNEAVCVWDVTSGNRLETYAIAGEPGSTTISINGAAAHLIRPGDVVIVAAFCLLEDHEACNYQPKVVFVDENNKIKQLRKEIPGGPKVKL